MMSRTSPSKPRGFIHHQPDLNSFCTAVASGDIEAVKKMISNGADVNSRASDGSLPLCTAAFWGYADIVNLLLENGADINGCNRTTGWTAAHCAAFQGNGRVLMFLTKHDSLDLSIKDSLGRTAVDFASAQDQIWPFFSVLGCEQTTKERLVKLEIITKASDRPDPKDGAGPVSQKSIGRYSRPGSSYVLSLKEADKGEIDSAGKPSAAWLYGDVLSEEQ